jgi:hypothetical protein
MLVFSCLGVIFSSNWPVQKNDVWALVLAPEKCANLSEVTLFTSFVQRESEMTVVFSISVNRALGHICHCFILLLRSCPWS